jgi:hypothetical protein
MKQCRAAKVDEAPLELVLDNEAPNGNVLAPLAALLIALVDAEGVEDLKINTALTD